MKRSEINARIAAAEKLLADHRISLPPWAHWPAAAWSQVGVRAAEIAWHGLGWDLTDFGSGDYQRVGLLLFTLRNGRLDQPVSAKTYAEKILISDPGQVLPTHYHWQKTEDIIVRAGGRMAIGLWNAGPSDEVADSDVVVSCDGVQEQHPAGSTLILEPGQSITLTPRLYHSFWGKEGDPPCIMGEVSAVNDDHNDNRFLDLLGRFPAIEEDEPPLRLLCTEYPPSMLPAAGSKGAA